MPPQQTSAFATASGDELAGRCTHPQNCTVVRDCEGKQEVHSMIIICEQYTFTGGTPLFIN